MSNTSATGGYVRPISTLGFPKGLTIEQFIQTVLVGVSGIDGTLVRPRWQPAPPKEPNIEVSWISFGVNIAKPDANAYVDMNAAGNTVSQRHQELEIPLSIYGPNALDTATLIEDGFQIQQNLEAMRFANMGFVSTSAALHLPEPVNERWFNRYEMSIFLRREIQRMYPILSILSAAGGVHTVLGNEPYLLNWKSPSST